MQSTVKGASSSGAYMASTSIAKLALSSDTEKLQAFCPKSAIMFLQTSIIKFAHITSFHNCMSTFSAKYVLARCCQFADAWQRNLW